VIIFLAVFVALALAKTKWNELEGYEFGDYLTEFGKQYSAEEYINRKFLFDANLAKIKKHNSDPTKSWKEGVNQFTDKNQNEFDRVLGLNKALLYESKMKRSESISVENIDISTLPIEVDWRTKGIITSVKDQGDCGSCWTFGTAETIESYWAISQGNICDLSEQMILDCVPNPNDCGGTGGCNGGTPELAYAQIIKMGGISSEWTYPYISYFGQNQSCNSASAPAMAIVKNFTVLPSNQYAPVLQHLANVGPLAVNVDASSWGSYESGVFDGCNLVNPDIDHVVQLVGYGNDPFYGDYWLVRNSWNVLWGEKGYIRLKRYGNNDTPCGIDLNPMDGTGCSNGPKQVTVCGNCAILYDTSYVGF